MKKTCLFHKTLPALALALALGACGGGGGGDDSSPGGGGSGGGSGGQTQSGSISACFSVDKTVNFKVLGINVPSGVVAPYKNTTGPMTYNGRAVLGQTWYYSGAETTSATYLWTVTSSGVTPITWVHTMSDGSSVIVAPITNAYPSDWSPGQSVNYSIDHGNNYIQRGTMTFVAFETITLAGKTFSNTCHLRQVENNTVVFEQWWVQGYGNIKAIDNFLGGTYQYNGDL